MRWREPALRKQGRLFSSFFALNILHTFEFFTSNPTRPAQQRNSTVNFVGVGEKPIKHLSWASLSFASLLVVGKVGILKNLKKKIWELLSVVHEASTWKAGLVGGGLFSSWNFQNK